MDIFVLRGRSERDKIGLASENWNCSLTILWFMLGARYASATSIWILSNAWELWFFYGIWRNQVKAMTESAKCVQKLSILTDSALSLAKFLIITGSFKGLSVFDNWFKYILLFLHYVRTSVWDLCAAFSSGFRLRFFQLSLFDWVLCCWIDVSGSRCYALQQQQNGLFVSS